MKLPRLDAIDFGPQPNFGATAKFAFVFALECAIAMLFFTVYSQAIDLMSNNYLSDMPLLGWLFSIVSPDANASHLVAGLLTVFSIGTPIVIWQGVIKNNIFENTQEWICHPQNKILAGLSVLFLALVIGLEVICLRAMILRQSADEVGGFGTQAQSSELLTMVAQNESLALGASIVIAVINLTLAVFTVITFHSLKDSAQEIQNG